MDDFDYVDQVFCEIVDKEEKYGSNALTNNEKALLAVWHATGLIGNGGLQNFIVWEDANPKVAEYFDELGLSGPAQVIRDFFLLFPDTDFESYSSAKRDDFIVKNVGKVQNEIDTLNHRFYSLMPTVEIEAAAFIRRHKGKL